MDGASATAPLTRDLYSEQRMVEAAVSTLPLVWGQGLTAYLEHYEYSCTEQLVSKGLSRAHPDLAPGVRHDQKPR